MFADAITALHRGEVIAVPTEAVYGLSVDPQNHSAVETLLKLKNRDPEKGFILVASEISQLEPYLQDLSPEIKNKLLSNWPGPYTWIVPARESISKLLTGRHNTIAVRVTAHSDLSQLCAEFKGALVSTSANLEGQPPAMSEKTVREYFGNDILIVPGTLGGLDKPTEIRDAITDNVIRV